MLVKPGRYSPATAPCSERQAPPKNLSDRARREALARAITDRENYWFASAFANRIWGELMGQAFYEPVDDLGPGKPVVFGHTRTEFLPQELSKYTPEDPTDLFAGENVLGIDTGCGNGGFLTGIELPGLRVYESR